MFASIYSIPNEKENHFDRLRSIDSIQDDFFRIHCEEKNDGVDYRCIQSQRNTKRNFRIRCTIFLMYDAFIFEFF